MFDVVQVCRCTDEWIVKPVAGKAGERGTTGGPGTFKAVLHTAAGNRETVNPRRRPRKVNASPRASSGVIPLPSGNEGTPQGHLPPGGLFLCPFLSPPSLAAHPSGRRFRAVKNGSRPFFMSAVPGRFPGTKKRFIALWREVSLQPERDSGRDALPGTPQVRPCRLPFERPVLKGPGRASRPEPLSSDPRRHGPSRDSGTRRSQKA